LSLRAYVESRGPRSPQTGHPGLLRALPQGAQPMIAGITTMVAFVLVLCIMMAVYRVVVGPSLPDRVIALDVIGTNIVGLILVLEIKSDSRALVDAALVIALLAFMGTVALAKYLAGGTVIDRGDH